jgi:uncharacterized cupredoxin-like copper-binding protein
MRGGTASAAVVVGVVSFAIGCGDDDDGGAAAGGGEVNVVLSEFIVEPDPDSADAGEITFVVDNQGGETHEFVVVEAASADELPLADDESFDEEAFGEENVLGEVEDVASGDTEDLTLDLEPGSYLLLCNIVEEEDGESESHFAEGMHASFTVE